MMMTAYVPNLLSTIVSEEFHEVLGLNEPLILGNPWLDKHGPLIIERDAVFLNNIWMDRNGQGSCAWSRIGGWHDRAADLA